MVRSRLPRENPPRTALEVLASPNERPQKRRGAATSQLVSRRYEHRSLLITTNLPFKRWDTVFPNASCAVALIDRLTHHVEILLLEGRSYRSYRRREAEISQQERNRQRPHRDDAPQ